MKDNRKYDYIPLENAVCKARLMIYEDGQQHISTLHPYDNTDYHYANSKDGENWVLCYDRRAVSEITTKDPNVVVAKLRELDKSKGLKRQTAIN